jgi:YesN/AraC family two-component response regulator
MKNKQIIAELVKLGKNFTILYVEDEENIRSQMKNFFEQIFKNVIIGEDGEDGLRLYSENSVDIVMTDIDMPVMNGLEMSKQIRDNSYDIPIGVISAFEDTLRFSGAIDIGITKYIVKPIKKESIIIALYDMVKNLQNKIDAKKYHKHLQNKKLSKAVKKTAQYFLQSIPSPVFVVDANKKIVYVNELLNDMLLQKNIEVHSGDSSQKIESIFLLDNGEDMSIDTIESDLSLNQKIRYANENKYLDFIPLKQTIEIPTVDGEGAIIVLNDVTVQMKQIHMIEYQKQKLQSNKEILEEFLSRNVFKVSQEEKEEVQKVLEKSEFNENEALLRRTHVYKISATDYITTLSDTIEDDLDELNELELDLQSELYEFEYLPKYETLETMAGIFSSYARTLVRLIEFSDLGDAVEATSSYLGELTQEHIDSNAFMIKEVMQSIHDDLSNWKEIVFITQKTDDIHYLDSSLYNTIIELKNVLESDGEDEEDDDDDDLEFF